MATVFLAQDLRQSRPVALKVLHPELGSTVGADRFKREIRVAARLQHPNIVGILDSGETEGAPEDGGGQLWFTMPLVEGENVYERLEREHQFSPAEALRIATAVAGGRAHPHPHRGVPPPNQTPHKPLFRGPGVGGRFWGGPAGGGGGEKSTPTGRGVGRPP